MMSDTKTIICLANSKKHGGTCFAGIEITNGAVGGWIRPVSARPGHEVNSIEQTLPDGSSPRALDIIKVGLHGPRPAPPQRENWLLDSATRWSYEGRISFTDARSLTADVATLWTNVSSSVGINDRVPEADLANYGYSIVLVEAVAAAVVVARNPYGRRDIEVRLNFRHRGTTHELKITDVDYYATYLARGVGRYPLHPQTLVTLSLAEPYAAPQPGAASYSYKVVAAIIEPTGRGGNAG